MGAIVWITMCEATNHGDVSGQKAMTVFWSTMAQEMTVHPMKGTLNWSFVRNDLPRFETCNQISLAIKDEVEDLEKAGITVIQIDEAALREALPLRKAEHGFYLDWVVHSFRITNVGVQDSTQIHTHICYSNLNGIIHSIINMDADVITIENSRSDEKLLSVFHAGVKYGAGIGPGVYDIHSPRIPSMEEIHDRVNKMHYKKKLFSPRFFCDDKFVVAKRSLNDKNFIFPSLKVK